MKWFVSLMGLLILSGFTTIAKAQTPDYQLPGWQRPLIPAESLCRDLSHTLEVNRYILFNPDSPQHRALLTRAAHVSGVSMHRGVTPMALLGELITARVRDNGQVVQPTEDHTDRWWTTRYRVWVRLRGEAPAVLICRGAILNSAVLNESWFHPYQLVIVPIEQPPPESLVRFLPRPPSSTRIVLRDYLSVTFTLTID